MKTYMQKKSDVQRGWHVVDAQDKVLGRLASEIAEYLIGKHKPTYTPHIDGGDYVVVINAAQIAVTGNKASDKMYFRHSGFPGGLKKISFENLREKFPERTIQYAVKNMLPKNKLRSNRMNRLKVYAGAEHPHASQVESNQ